MSDGIHGGTGGGRGVDDGAESERTGFEDDDPVVVVVDDDVDVAETYAMWLGDRYRVRTAFGGEEALEVVDGDVDVVLLDRRMPHYSGDEVLEAIRDRGLDCQVAMITAVEPDSDIVDLPFEEYVTKPVTDDDLLEVVEELLARREFDEATREYLSLSSTEAAIESRGADTLRDETAVEDLRAAVADAEADATDARLDDLSRLKRVNELIRNVNRALVESSTRDEIESQVCEMLVDDDAYAFAFVGQYAAAYDDLTVREASGEASVDANALLESGIGDPAAARVETVADPPSPVGAAEAVAVSIPLSYRQNTYGTLVVFAPPNHEVTDRERAVLGELGDSVAHAINSVENRKLLFADTVVELELRVTDRTDALVDLSADLDCHVSLEGFVPSADGDVTCYVTVEDAAADELAAALTATDAVTGHRAIDAESDPIQYEVALGDDSILLTALGVSGNVRTLDVDGGEGTFVIEVAPDADVRNTLETLQSAFEDSEFVRKRSLDRSFQSTDPSWSELDDDLTVRQREVLEAAFDAGYFEWPRASDGEELAEALDISSATLHQHLRHAMSKLAESYLYGRG